MTDIVILAGGYGKRLGKITNKKQKVMIEFYKRPFLRYIVNYYSKFNFKNIYIVCGYKSREIIEEFHDTKVNFVNIKCIFEKNPSGTAGAIKCVKNLVSEKFLLVNGDTFFHINLNKLINLKLNNKIGCCVLVNKKKNLSSYKLNNLSIKKNLLQIDNFNGKFMNSGIILLSKKIFKHFDNKNSSFEQDILEKLIKKNKIIGIYEKGFFIDIGSPEYLKKAKKNLIYYFKKPAVFFDRDGVINKNRDDYNYRVSNFKFNQGFLNLLKKLKKKGYFTFVITNQAGIAKGKYTEDDFIKLQLYIKKKLNQKNLNLDHVEYCPHHIDGVIKKYQKKCLCRKPNNLLVKNIFDKWFIEKNSSIFIGDKKTDEMCAKKSNLKFYYFDKNLHKNITLK
jgi:D,D-heptose 1,7-bisphosphate phosphatase